MLPRIAALLAVAAVPSAMAVQYAASLPEALVSKAATDECRLPDDFKIQNFGGSSIDGGATLSSMDFTFYDDTVELTAACHLNESSVAIEIPGRTPRWPCDDENVAFIWQDGQLTMIEEVCPGTDGSEIYEASGSVSLVFKCASTSYGTGPAHCSLANSTELAGTFYSINPVPSS